MGGDLIAAGTTTIATDAVFRIGGAGDRDANVRRIVNQGEVVWDGGNVRGGNGSSIVNAGLWRDAGTAGHDINRAYGGDGGAFTNTGTYRKTTATTTRITQQTFDNPGELHVEAGRMELNGGVAQIQGNRLTGGTWHAGPPTRRSRSRAIRSSR